MIACTQQETCLCNLQLISMMLPQSEICLSQVLSMDVDVSLDQGTYWAAACIWIGNILNKLTVQDQFIQVLIQSWPKAVSFACSLHLFNPRCPPCMSLNTASHFLFGTTILVPFKTRPSFTVSSSLNVQYGCNTLGTSLIVFGQACVILCLSNASSSSSCVANLC